jgi:ribosome recycling factor
MINELKRDTESRMDKAIQAIRSDLGKIRTGKATPALLDGITVEYYGSKVPLNQVANVGAPEPRLLVIQPWEKSLLVAIEKEIQKADLGFNPTNDGIVIRIPIPQLTEESRQSLVKLAKKQGEDSKISIRNIRRDANEKLKSAEKTHDISEDNMHSTMDDVQKLTDSNIKLVDDILDLKEKEILEI